MKNTFRTMTTVLAGLALTLGLTVSSCKKAEKGETGPTGPTGAQGQAGPQAKTFNFSLTFNAGSTFASYSGITGFDTDDVILFYAEYETIGSTSYWSPLPLSSASLRIIPEFSETTGLVYINTYNATTGSPWTSTTVLNFKAVLIKSAQRIANPNVNLNDYTAVKKAYNLKD